MDKEKIKEKYMEFQLYQQQLEQLQKYAEQLESKHKEYTVTEESLGELENVKQGTEILVPLAEGIFVKAHIADAEQFVVNIGAGVSCEKARKDVIAIVKDQLTEMADARGKITDKITEINMKMMAIAHEMENME